MRVPQHDAPFFTIATNLNGRIESRGCELDDAQRLPNGVRDFVSDGFFFPQLKIIKELIVFDICGERIVLFIR